MTQSSVAVSADNRNWVLLNASPDIRVQIQATPVLHPRGLRHSPLRAVIATNGDVDHVAGLLTLREKTPLTLFATPATQATLAANSVFGVLDPVLVTRQQIVLDAPFEAAPGLFVTAYAVPGKVPLYLEKEGFGQDHAQLRALGEQTIGLRIASGKGVLHYVPGCAEVPDWLCERLADADLLFFDGTVWADDDMTKSCTGKKTGTRMGHIPMSGRQGSLARLSRLRCRRVFIHINNTNPVLMPEATERSEVHRAGWELAHDGMEIAL
jgi:pyrroloquinoline quinone biosynthesis protein B